MPHCTGLESEDVPKVINGFPVNHPLPFNLQAASNPSKSHWLVQLLESAWNEIIFAWSAGVRASTVSNGTEGVRRIASGSLEASIGVLDHCLHSNQVNRFELAGVELSLGTSELSQVVFQSCLRMQLHDGASLNQLTKQSHG